MKYFNPNMYLLSYIISKWMKTLELISDHIERRNRKQILHENYFAFIELTFRQKRVTSKTS